MRECVCCNNLTEHYVDNAHLFAFSSLLQTKCKKHVPSFSSRILLWVKHQISRKTHTSRSLPHLLNSNFWGRGVWLVITAPITSARNAALRDDVHPWWYPSAAKHCICYWAAGFHTETAHFSLKGGRGRQLRYSVNTQPHGVMISTLSILARGASRADVKLGTLKWFPSLLLRRLWEWRLLWQPFANVWRTRLHLPLRKLLNRFKTPFKFFRY